MDVSNRENSTAQDLLQATDAPQAGHELLSALVALTGLPTTAVKDELVGILENAGHSPATLTIDQLRGAMLAYLESMQGDLLMSEEPAAGDSTVEN